MSSTRPLWATTRRDRAESRASATGGWSVRNRRNGWPSTAHAVVSATQVAEPDRGMPPRTASSPSRSPEETMATTRTLPSAVVVVTSTRPVRMQYTASGGSPWTNMTVPARYRCSRPWPAKEAPTCGDTPLNSGSAANATSGEGA